MKRGARIRSITLGLLLIVGLGVGCDSGSDPASGLLASAPSTLDEDGFGLMADPVDVVVDTTTDPPEDSGETTLIATVLDPADDLPLEGVEVRFASDAGTLASGGSPVLTDPNGVATDTLTVSLSDADAIEVTAVESFLERTESVTVNKIVILPNRPPVADAGMDVETPCDSTVGATVTLDGSNSSDPDSTLDTNDDIVSFEWFEDYQTPDELRLGDGPSLEVNLSFGVHVITLVVADSEGLTDTDEITVEIIDVEPPDVSVMTQPMMLWPPNHRMVDVTAELTIGDCSAVAVELVSVSSDEPPNGTGDGDTEPDISGAEIGAEDYEFQLRAERAGGGDGRTYTVVYLVTDEAGLSTEVVAHVEVPHDQRPR
jgi:hypothetical protein